MVAVFLPTAIFVIFLIHELWWKRRHLPPGPIPLPLFGNLLEMQKAEPGYDAFTKLTNEYGPIYTFWLGNTPMIMVTDYNLMHEMFVKDGQSYVGRTNLPLRTQLRGGPYGVIEAEGELWQNQRRFALHVLRDFGLGQNLMEKRILVEVSSLIDQLRNIAKSGAAIDIQDMFDASIGSVINTMIFGFRYDESNMSEFLQLKRHLATMMETGGKPMGQLVSFYPWLAKLPFFSTYAEEIETSFEKLKAMFRTNIAEQKQNMNFENDDFSDVAEAFLKEQHRNPNDETFCDLQLENLCFDLWIAGMETTSNTLYWGVLYVLLDKEVQNKLHQELSTKINSDRPITMDDKAALHYFNAVVAEIQRLANLLPINVLHKTTRDVLVNGFHIAKDTTIVPQICCALYDEKVFPEPLNFDPSRHLHSNGHFVKIDQLVPFSMGKRQCLGESLARAELFLFLANFFNQFQVLPENERNLPSTKKRFGMTVKAINYSIRLKSRY